MNYLFSKKQKTIFFTFFTFFSVHLGVAQGPNFVVIVVDDMGWTGSSVQVDENISNSKSDFYFTPQILAMAKAGMTFSQGYSSSPKCAPSRCSILTGRTTARNSFTSTDNDIAANKILIEATTDTSLNGSDTTYAEWLKYSGMNYRTAHFGKWHLGNQTDSSPEKNGFDFGDGATNNSNGNQGNTIQADPKKIFDLTNRSIAFIQEAVKDNVPFSLQLSHYAVHSDIETRQATLDLYNDKTKRPLGTRHTNPEYGAMTEDTDDGIGLLLAELTRLGLDDNTYVFLFSDNGGQLNFTDNTPLSFGKTFITEGGIRVPFIVKGPGIPANTYNTEAVIQYDLFPTIAALTGSTVKLPANIDGQSIVPLLKKNDFTRSEPLYFHSPHYDTNPNKTPRSAVVKGKYKLMVEYEKGSMKLYDLSTDIGESTDISSTNLSLKNELLLKLRDHLKSTKALMPTLDPTHASFSSTGEDIDADGLADSWEFTELLTYTYGANDDPDNDGMTNLAEFKAGTDPLMGGDSNECDLNEIFANETTNAVCFKLDENVRTCYTNNIPDHNFGPFAGANDIEGQDFTYSMCRYPQLGTTTTPLVEDLTLTGCTGGIVFGVSHQGVNYSPFARLYWANPTTKEENKAWNIEADFELTMDLNGGHVNAVNRYHYHNIPKDYLTKVLKLDGSKHSPILGYAADGFPIYYKYLYTDSKKTTSDITGFVSSYTLKSGSRTGNGTTAPDGNYDGNYVQDYEYITDLSALDECGGRFAITPEYPDGTYYYVLTDNWPYIPRCLKGAAIDNSFRIGPKCPISTAQNDCKKSEVSPLLKIAQNNLEIVVYPNPSNGYIYIRTDMKSRAIRIYDLNASIHYNSSVLEKKIDISSFPKGTYFIQITSQKSQFTKRIIIK